MLKITGLQASLSGQDKQILQDVHLTLKPGEIHVLQGANGSGKSTLASVISGHPGFEITDGKIELVDEVYPKHLTEKILPDLETDTILVNDLSPEQRALAGLFLAHQYPLEIPGVNLSNFLCLAYNARVEKDLPVFKFRKLLKEKAALINYPEHLIDRNLNEGFSGGEKKKTEILQLALLEPRYAILDETDSGLDRQAIADVFTGIQQLHQHRLQSQDRSRPALALLIITHYEKVFDYIQPDFTHTMQDGILK